MPSRSTHRSHNRNHSKRHKKSHKRTRKLSDERSPSSSNNSTKKEKISNDNDKLAIKEEETVKTSTEDQLTIDSITSDIQITVKRKTRWIGDESDKVFFPNMPTTISTTNMTEKQQKIYPLKLHVEDLTRRLKTNDLGISSNPENRSPSPEPIYDQQGKRQNTREVRARRKIEEERHQLVTELLLLDPDYKPPGDYRPQHFKYTDKIVLPQEDYPKVNFIGLILGPRGTTLKMLEKESNVKITIRGKGSRNDGKMGLIKNFPLPGEDEPLHVYITGSSLEIVTKAVEKIQELINQIIDAPDGLNDFRKEQFRQLALINGTLRENDGLMKLKLLNEAEKIVTNTIICTVCGGAGHISTDCKFRKKPDGNYAELNSGGSFMNNGNRQEQQKFDCEYQSLKDELAGKKDTNTNTLSLDDQRNLMSGSRTTGPTLPIADGSSSTIINSKATVKTVGTVSYNSNGSFNTDNNYESPSLMSLKTNINSNPSNNQSNYSNTLFSSTGPRYNNNDIFDGYSLLRRTNQNNNYSSYIEGDSYRAQHIPALIENNRNYHSQQQTYSNQQWNQYNTAMYYQQQYYSNNNIRFTPPLPREPPPPLPPR